MPEQIKPWWPWCSHNPLKKRIFFFFLEFSESNMQIEGRQNTVSTNNIVFFKELSQTQNIIFHAWKMICIRTKLVISILWEHKNFTFLLCWNFGWVTKSNILGHWFIKLHKHLLFLHILLLLLVSRYHAPLYSLSSLFFFFFFNIVRFLLNNVNNIFTFRSILAKPLTIITFNIRIVIPFSIWP